MRSHWNLNIPSIPQYCVSRPKYKSPLSWLTSTVVWHDIIHSNWKDAYTLMGSKYTSHPLFCVSRPEYKSPLSWLTTVDSTVKSAQCHNGQDNGSCKN